MRRQLAIRDIAIQLEEPHKTCRRAAACPPLVYLNPFFVRITSVALTHKHFTGDCVSRTGPNKSFTCEVTQLDRIAMSSTEEFILIKRNFSISGVALSLDWWMLWCRFEFCRA